MLPDIKAKWPAEGRHETIWIQQDNCRSHIPVDDPEFCAAAQADGWDIRLTCQPANSPDTNVLDLGLFAAIQALFHRSGMPKTIDEIVNKVQAAYWNFPVGRSNRVFLTLQGCLREILKEKGGQHYPVPHMKKAMLERLGTQTTSPPSSEWTTSLLAERTISLPAEQTTSPPSAEQTTSLPAERTISPPWSETTISLPAVGALAMGRKERARWNGEERHRSTFIPVRWTARLPRFNSRHVPRTEEAREGAPYIEKKSRKCCDA